MHSLYKPRPGVLKTILLSLKLTAINRYIPLIGPHGVPVEVQIRTEDMDQMAEMGLLRIGHIKSKANKVQQHKLELNVGCKVYLSYNKVQVARLNLLKALNRIYFQMKSTFSP